MGKPKQILDNRSAEIFERWGIYYSESADNWITNRPVNCTFENKPLSRGTVVAVRGEIIGVTSIEHLVNKLMFSLFEDKSLECIQLLAFDCKH